MRFRQSLKFLILGIVCFQGSLLFGQDTFWDNFNTASYSNNNGTLSFSADWVDNEDGDFNNGRIQINSNQLRFENMDGAEISRTLDMTGGTGVTLTMSYNRTSGNERIAVQLWNGTGWNEVAVLNGTGTVNYSLAANEISANSEIRFVTDSGGWSNGEIIFVDNVIFSGNFPPNITIDNVTVNEDDGTATFTVILTKAVSGGLTVDYATSDGTALAGSDYTATSGTLVFAGTAGETQNIVVPLIDDAVPEFIDETFNVVLSNVSDPSVIVASNTGIGTIIDDEYAFNAPLVLTHEFDGYMDYTSTAGTLRTEPNTGNTCAITTSSSNTLSSPIPATATIEQAILYWAHSGATPDTQVTFDGTTVNAEFLYGTTLTNRSFFGGRADVTAIVTAVPNPSTYLWTFSGLTIDNTNPYCNTATTLGGWSLMIFYTDNSLPASTINVYEGFSGESNSSSSYTLSGFFAIGATGSKTTVQSWEGDQTLSNNESLTVTTGLGTFNLVGDGDNTGLPTINPFNSTHYDNTSAPVVNNTNSHGVDLDTYNISPFISPGETSVTTNVGSGQDFVILNTVTLKVPSNLTTGIVFEDVNYGGGPGRNRATAGGVPIPNATVELYNGGGSLVTTTTTNAAGRYVFAGMANGAYTVRVVNNSVRSTRPGGSTCTTCIPVQTFKTDYLASIVVEDTNSVGGEDPSGEDPGPGTLNNAQSISSFTILNEGIAGMDFGFNFNTIVNTNEEGQGSLEQFIVNSNALGETGLDIEANALFDPGAGDDTSVFMIPPAGDALGRPADGNYNGNYFEIDIPNPVTLTSITGDNTHIDGRTQTAYSGNTNTGTVGAGGSPVGISATNLPSFDLPEIQLYKGSGNVLTTQGTAAVIRNMAIYANNNTALIINGGDVTVSNMLLGVDATGANGGNIDYGISMNNGASIIDGNYIATNQEAGIGIAGGTSTLVQNNHITSNGNGPCADNINITGGSGVVIQQNLIELSGAMGIEGSGIAGGVTITENTITTAGQNGGNCSGQNENAGIRLEGNNSSITQNIIYQNGGAGIVLGGGNTSGNLISQNSIYANGTSADALGIDLDQADGMGDGVTLNDNGDSDTGPNGAANFPLISAAYMEGSNVVIKGWSRPGATLEFFLTDINEGTATAGDNQLGYSKDYGEGQIYLGSAVEGSGADSDAGSSSYLDTDGNTDNTNRFEVRIPAPPGLSVGNLLTGTATLANTTSEFSPFSEIVVRTVITNRRITYRVNPN
ncbi:Carboxypeptidase regulatory-like domain-containing protein [Muriicola jejuensis]|uniref:Sodium:calcium exchanger n=1 Tax=Muriicola jejuensis TaxID=504488 RepID=A0A6P0UGE1_9FLAO|nr:Calx-beta domain-containing protein [Muriicola jejuensis]NER09186.1 sodium:calcium exchanger [Muriicola jejuensis]SMP10492.1 Carboxypeptidase regulatory-like domain-containing protein [Muriicola jejuensis]